MKNKSAFVSVMLWPLVILLAVAALLWAERMGLQPEALQSNPEAGSLSSPFLSDELMAAPLAASAKECLVLTNTTEEANGEYVNHITFVLDDMRVGYDIVDVSAAEIPEFNTYRTVVVALHSMNKMGESNVFRMLEWLELGGRAYFMRFPEIDDAFGAIRQKLGITENSYDSVVVEGMRILTDFMIDSEGFDYVWEAPWEASVAVQLDESCTVHVESMGKYAVPMLWEKKVGNGKVVVANHELAEKATRGLTCAAYSLLEDAFCYPVINACAFYIDDFPSPVPDGFSEYISRDYPMSIAQFYKNVWWPQMLELSRKYGIKYVGLIIETYGDDVNGPFSRQTDIDSFSYFGNSVLLNGGELGLHGYNHMSLVLEDFDYKGKLDYVKWKRIEDMRTSIEELFAFSNGLFPNYTFTTYIPPSNVLSDEGVQALIEAIPTLKIIAGVYHQDDIGMAYEQEFTQYENGLIGFPRVTSGFVLEEFTEWALLNEIAFHYVTSHFIHPDDVLDIERGADYGWDYLISGLDESMKNLFESAKGLRNLTSTESGLAVQRYCHMTIVRTLTENGYVIDINGFETDAQFIFRAKKQVASVTGGTFTELGGGLYLIDADASRVEITYSEAVS